MSQAPRTRQLVVLARWPAPGRCKRRLAAGVGPRRAATIQERLCLHSLEAGRSAAAASAETGGGFQLVLAVSGVGRRAAERWGRALGADRVVLQGPGGLGLRLQRQVVRAQREGVRRLVLIGSDLPVLEPGDLGQAFLSLERGPLVLGPAADGGYWLIGLAGNWPVLFAGHREPIAWGGPQVLEQTLRAARGCNLTAAQLARRGDLDRPEDLGRWR